MSADQIDAQLLRAIQIAILGEVTPALRSVTCDWKNAEIALRLLFDGPVGDGEKEIASIAAAEVIAAFDAPWVIFEEVERLDYPADRKIRALRLWPYARREPQRLG